MGDGCEPLGARNHMVTEVEFKRIVGQGYACLAMKTWISSDGRTRCCFGSRPAHRAGISALETGSGRNIESRNRRCVSAGCQREDRCKNQGYFSEVYNKYTHVPPFVP